MTYVSDNNCDNVISDEQTVTVHEPPTVSLDSEVCNPIGTAYSVCFTITGGDDSCYEVTPNTGVLTGNQFCSDPINSGDGYSFSVTDCHGCPPTMKRQNIEQSYLQSLVVGFMVVLTWSSCLTCGPQLDPNSHC